VPVFFSAFMDELEKVARKRKKTLGQRIAYLIGKFIKRREALKHGGHALIDRRRGVAWRIR
jgi:hypothetical protein